MAGGSSKFCEAHRSRYGAAHRAKRANEIEAAYGQPCSRCHKPMREGQELHLDHLDGGGPDEYRGFSHQSCNVRASNYRAAERARAALGVTNEPSEWPWRKVAPGCVDRADPRQWAPSQQWLHGC